MKTVQLNMTDGWILAVTRPAVTALRNLHAVCIKNIIFNAIDMCKIHCWYFKNSTFVRVTNCKFDLNVLNYNCSIYSY